MSWEPVTEQDKITLAKIKANPFYATCFKMLSGENPLHKELPLPRSYHFGAFNLFYQDFRKLKVKKWKDLTQNFNGFVKIIKKASKEFKTQDPEVLFAVAFLKIGTVRKLKYNHKLTMSQEADLEQFRKRVLPKFRRVYGEFCSKK